MEQIKLTLDEINVIFRYCTESFPALSFEIIPDGEGVYCAVALVEITNETGKYNRVERWYFKRDETKKSEPGYFGGDSSLHFCGSWSSPVFPVGDRRFCAERGNYYTV